jgi:hypothetical protein
MYSPKEVGASFYLETNHSRNNIKQRILKLGDRYRDGVSQSSSVNDRPFPTS